MGILTRVGACIVLGALLAVAPVAHAQPAGKRAEARALANRGFELFQEGRYGEANAHFRQAEQVHSAPTLQLWIGRTYVKEGKLADAEVMLTRVATRTVAPNDPPAFAAARDDARKRLEALAPRVARVTVRVVDASGRPVSGAVVSLDGRLIDDASTPFGVNPGRHQLRVQVGSGTPDVRALELSEGSREQVVVRATIPSAPVGPPAEPAAESDLQVPAIAAYAAGGVGLVIGIAAGAAALGTHAELEEACPTKNCLPEHETLADETDAQATASTVGFVVAALGAATGTTLLLLDGGSAQADEARTQLRVRWTGWGASMEGTF